VTNAAGQPLPDFAIAAIPAADLMRLQEEIARLAGNNALLYSQAEGNRQHYHVLYVACEVVYGRGLTERLVNGGLEVLRGAGAETKPRADLDAELRRKITEILAATSTPTP
jgi:hypothetical protein